MADEIEALKTPTGNIESKLKRSSTAEKVPSANFVNKREAVFKRTTLEGESQSLAYEIDIVNTYRSSFFLKNPA